MRIPNVLGIGCLLAVLVSGCGGNDGGPGGDMRGSVPNAGNGWLLIGNPASGAFQTDQLAVSLSGNSFIPNGAECLPAAFLPPAYQVTWSNNSTGAAGNASSGINCVGIVFVHWNVVNIPLAMGANSISVIAIDGSGNVGGDTIVVTRVADTTAPTVVSASPGNGAINVQRTTSVMVTFSESMDPSTIDATTFTLSDGATNVTAAVGYDSFSLSATLTPSILLAPNTIYQVTVTTAVQDLSGSNALAAPYTFSFRTGF